jgi:hypothetical protein
MRKYVTLLVLLAVMVTGGVTWRLVYFAGQRPEATFRGWTTRQWEGEISRRGPSIWGEPVIDPGQLGPAPEPPAWVTWLGKAGFRIERDKSSFSLLAGDPDALPVLVELLESADPRARRVGAYGLRAIGPRARQAVPALLKALGDPDVAVRFAAGGSLRRVDEDAAEAAGCFNCIPARP